jgi:hypothetical protein
MSFPTWNADWRPLPGPEVFDLATQHVAAVSRAPGVLDLFVIGNDSRVWTNNWSQTRTTSGGWNADWGALPGQAKFNLSTQHVAAVSRAPGVIDLFVIGSDAAGNNGHVWTNNWSQAGTTNGGWNADWGPLPGSAVFDFATQHVAVVSQSQENLDLFVIGDDSRVWSDQWSQGGGWSGDWRPLPGQAKFNLSTQHVAAVSRAPGVLDLFVIGSDAVGNNGHVWTNNWSVHPANPSISSRAVEDAGRFIEVTGLGFTPYQRVKLNYDITTSGSPTTDQIGEDDISSDGTGAFIQNIQINLPGDISGAQVKATDLASDATAEGAI